MRNTWAVLALSMATRTKEECKRILSTLGFKLGVSPHLIATRLLSEDDKNDMLNGDLPLDALETAIKVWMASKMPDYANGHTDHLRPSKLIGANNVVVT